MARGSSRLAANRGQLYVYIVKLLAVVWQGCSICLFQAFFLSFSLEFGETKMILLWSGNYDLIWPAQEQYDAVYNMGMLSLLQKVTERSAS